VEHLFHPETGCRAVEQADQGQVIVLCRPRRQLDDRCGSVEHLPAPVEEEVIMGRDEGEGDGERNPRPILRELMKIKPCSAIRSIG
jgi:hypothetical protein